MLRYLHQHIYILFKIPVGIISEIMEPVCLICASLDHHQQYSSIKVSPPLSSSNLPACVNQYSRGATEGFRHTGRATLISVLIRMGKGLWVQLQVILRVAQKGGGDEADLLEVMTPSAWQWWRRLGDVSLGERGKKKKGMETGSLPGTILNKHKSTRVKMLDLRLSHSTREKKNKLHPRHASSLDVDGHIQSPLLCCDYADYDPVINWTSKRLPRNRCL